MAIISPDTFDPLQRFVSVRLQQGVPIVDADINELDDIRRFEVRAFLKWFVGDGVPDGTDGFRVEGIGVANDFAVRFGGVGPPNPLNNAGRLVVDGRDVLMTADFNYTAQPLHQSQAGAAALAAFLGVPVIAPLTNPAADLTVTVYADVWDRLVTPAEQPALIFAGLGTESCARLRREFVIRTRTGTSAPVTGDADFIAGHSYYALARIARISGDPVIGAGAVTDRRERRLLMPPATLITDLFGVTASDYRRGLGRPAISVREAVNSLIRGQIPGTPDTAIAAAGTNVMRRSLLFAGPDSVAALWAPPAGGQVSIATANTETQQPVFTAPLQITSATPHGFPHAALLPNGDIFAIYEAGAGANRDIAFKRAPLAGLAAAPEQIVANTAAVPETQPFVVVSGIFAVCFHHLAGAINNWQFRRRQWTNNTWADAAPQQLSPQVTSQVDFHAAALANGDIWCAFRAVNDIQAVRLTPATAALFAPPVLDSGTADQTPFVLTRASGEVWVFWSSATGLQLARFTGGAAFQPIELVPGSAAADTFPAVVEDADGGLWLFFQRANDIFVMFLNPLTGVWAPPRQVTFNPAADQSPFALMAPNGAIWLQWLSDRGATFNPFFKRLVATL